MLRKHFFFQPTSTLWKRCVSGPTGPNENHENWRGTAHSRPSLVAQRMLVENPRLGWWWCYPALVPLWETSGGMIECPALMVILRLTKAPTRPTGCSSRHAYTIAALAGCNPGSLVDLGSLVEISEIVALSAEVNVHAWDGTGNSQCHMDSKMKWKRHAHARQVGMSP